MTDAPEIRVLRYFVAVAEELHFGRAAVRLHISQPSLSVQIRKLEHTLGARLLARTSRHVELTPAGVVLLEEAHRLLAGVERLTAATRRAADGAAGSLVVGFQANAAAELTPKILAAFQARCPRVQVEMRSHDFADPYVGLSTGSVDVAFVRPPIVVQSWLSMETLFVEPRVLVTSTDSPLAARGRITVADVVDEPFVGRRAPDYWRDFWLAVDTRGSHTVRLGAEVAGVDECFEAILSRRGVAFTQASTQRFYDRPGLAFVPVDGLPPSAVAIAWRNDMDAQPVRDFVDTTRALAALDLVPSSSPAAGAALAATTIAAVAR
ncbi:LysR substrate-binding domain-containing protein [Geodermatophilus sp. DSM 44513]|uniref:LysR family transcriptional regulator n=1 Tax=Geodermatophilus sp. DSM 44513 TaxID=1528104 RepID=UPI0012784E9A|nr:LysR substrate-binding domain-containing protein [Geodermatophilus sp. DSM 44513]WNV73682.1 LysR substrate-binding domain-containing protein [Geodermatophilus sp. DSM 44513]